MLLQVCTNTTVGPLASLTVTASLTPIEGMNSGFFHMGYLLFVTSKTVGHVSIVNSLNRVEVRGFVGPSFPLQNNLYVSRRERVMPIDAS